MTKNESNSRDIVLTPVTISKINSAAANAFNEGVLDQALLDGIIVNTLEHATNQKWHAVVHRLSNEYDYNVACEEIETYTIPFELPTTPTFKFDKQKHKCRPVSNCLIYGYVYIGLEKFGPLYILKIDDYHYDVERLYINDELLPKYEALCAKVITPLSYTTESFPSDALRWLEGAKEFFDVNKIEQFRRYKIPQQLGVILAGPPGNGKTMFATHIKRVLGMDVHSWSVSDLRNALDDGDKLQPTGIVIMDDIEELLLERSEGSSGAILPWLLVNSDAATANTRRLLVLITNHPEKIDDALLRPGRFDTCLEFLHPTKEQFKAIIKFHMGDDFDDAIADKISAKLAKTKKYTLAHVAYLVRLVISNFAKDWDEAFEYLKKYTIYSGVKDYHNRKEKAGF